MLNVLLIMFCFRAGRRIRIALLLYGVRAAYGIIRSREVRVIWDVYPVLLFYPYLRHYFWASINNLAQPVGEHEWMISLSFQPLLLLQRACENFLFPLDVKKCMFYCCVWYASLVWSMPLLGSRKRFLGRSFKDLPLVWVDLSGTEDGRNGTVWGEILCFNGLEVCP